MKNKIKKVGIIISIVSMLANHLMLNVVAPLLENTPYAKMYAYNIQKLYKTVENFSQKKTTIISVNNTILFNKNNLPNYKNIMSTIHIESVISVYQS